MSRLVSASRSALFFSSALDSSSARRCRSSSAVWSWSFVASSCDCFSSISVRVLTLIVLTLVAIISAICVRKSRSMCVNGLNEASSSTPSTRSSNSTGRMITVTGGASPRPEEIRR